ncbi:MAG: cysteine hydrolase family protein [Planctomycetota bacterium]|jgi:nicotinamidase-related amidase
MDVENVALIIVDMQNDFIHEKGAMRKVSEDMGIPKSSLDLLKVPVPNIIKLTEIFHKNGKKVIYLYIAWEPDYSDAAVPLSRLPAKERGALVRGKWGVQIIEELAPQDADMVIMKKGYGGFFQTPLDRILRNLGIKTLVASGVLTNFCVETTIREAVGYGYDVILVNDATASFDLEAHNATLRVIAMGFGEVMSTEETLKFLST